MFNSEGYPFRFIQCNPCRDGTGHECTFIYKFLSPDTGHSYVVEAARHEGNMYAVKFYSKRHRGHDLKYQLMVNRGHVPAILRTIADISIDILGRDPGASFVMVGVRSVDTVSGTMEPPVPSRRYRIYRVFVSRMFGPETFQHYELDRLSAYALVNRKRHPDLEAAKVRFLAMFKASYPTLEV